MADFILGMNAKLYQGDAGADVATMTENSNVKDVTLSLEAGEADISTRGNSGWRATAPTLRECNCEFEMVWRPGDAQFDAIKTAFLSSGTVGMAVLTGDSTVTGSEGPAGDWSITNFSRNEPLEEAVTVSVTAKLAKFTEWFVAA
ncbi:Phage major tail protein 2 [Anaerohalosphaera lusitana]|uniref:Phage major tail protein 2 n=1 Tax=Anaerohalosphaera lusitana TaxID=1936003 RepID=A0A1U9NJM7_9BACT|nr:phage tail tube protein [Anaerohalosphaera lusitana]AQT67948.1 Phage major tail protein 2 [Anaerohalosphaera lusitana]